MLDLYNKVLGQAGLISQKFCPYSLPSAATLKIHPKKIYTHKTKDSAQSRTNIAFKLPAASACGCPLVCQTNSHHHPQIQMLHR